MASSAASSSDDGAQHEESDAAKPSDVMLRKNSVYSTDTDDYAVEHLHDHRKVGNSRSSRRIDSLVADGPELRFIRDIRTGELVPLHQLEQPTNLFEESKRDEHENMHNDAPTQVPRAITRSLRIRYVGTFMLVTITFTSLPSKCIVISNVEMFCLFKSNRLCHSRNHWFGCLAVTLRG